jgi:hypothetical protein
MELINKLYWKNDPEIGKIVSIKYLVSIYSGKVEKIVIFVMEQQKISELVK